MKTAAIRVFGTLLCLLVIIISKPPASYAQSLIYSNDFEQDQLNQFPSNWNTSQNFQWGSPNSPCMNGANPAQWKIVDAFGSRRVGVSINGPSCVMEIVPTNLNIPNLSNYRYEVDMTLPNSVIKDRAIPFKWNGPGKVYGFTVKSVNELYFYKAVGAGYDYQLGIGNFSTGFVADTTYRFKIEVINNHINVYVNDNLVKSVDDQDPILSQGTIALHGSIGSYGPVTTYFDNIRVYDLTPEPTPTPTPTPPPPTPTPTISVPYMSQRDDAWKSDQYDFLSRTIEEVGCALTSTAMVLKHYGLNKVPLNNNLVDLTPGTLNQWLNLAENADSWWRDGSMSWGAITRLAKILHETDAQFTKLEYTVIASDSARLNEIIDTDRQPLIFKYEEPSSPSGLHFVTAFGTTATPSGNLYQIHDPWDQTHTELLFPPTNLYRAGHFYPTSSDLSFLFINTDITLTPTLKDSAGQLTGSWQKELPLANKLNPTDQTGQPYWNLSIKYPDSGLYTLSLSAPATDWYRFEIYAYNQDGAVEVIKEKVFITTTQPLIYQLKLAPSGSLPVAKITKKVSFSSLRDLIIAVHEKGWLNSKTKNQLLTHLNLAEKTYLTKPSKGTPLLHTFKLHLYAAYRLRQLVEPGYSLLVTETDRLIQSLR